MDRCDSCRTFYACPFCGTTARSLRHIGVRGTVNRLRIPIIDYNIDYDREPSGIWHYSQPCNHRVYPTAISSIVKYNGGPLWQDGYTWQDVYWGTFYAKPSTLAWINRLESAVADLESNSSYSGGLRQYNVGIGKVASPVKVSQDPPSQITNEQITSTLTGWIGSGSVPDVGTSGAYNIFLPPGTTVSLSGDLSCAKFCDYHDTVNGPSGPFYTVEPYPCAQGCNQCSKDPFDTLTQGLSEEMTELKTDMDPGSGWVIGNMEICDYCDTNFVCNKISTGEYVNSWYDKKKNACWLGQK